MVNINKDIKHQKSGMRYLSVSEKVQICQIIKPLLNPGMVLNMNASYVKHNIIRFHTSISLFCLF